MALASLGSSLEKCMSNSDEPSSFQMARSSLGCATSRISVEESDRKETYPCKALLVVSILPHRVDVE